MDRVGYFIPQAQKGFWTLYWLWYRRCIYFIQEISSDYMRICKHLIFIFVAYLVFPSFLQALTPMHEYTQAIENCPEDMKYKFYLLRGKAHKDSGSLELALQDLDASIRLNPNIKAYEYRGGVYLAMGKFTEAINDFTRAININPTIELYKLRGAAYLKLTDYVLALADGLNIINLAPYEAASYSISMEALENLEDISMMRELAFKVLSFNRNNKRANEIIVKYPLEFVFIGENPITIYVRERNDDIKSQANEILLMYKKGLKLDDYLKNKLNECIGIGEQIRLYQALLKGLWENYFEEIRSLQVRSRQIHDDLRNKYLDQTAAVERAIEIGEKKSEKCTEELFNAFMSSQKEK